MTDSLLRTVGMHHRTVREFQDSWATTSLVERLKIVRTFRHRLVANAESLHELIPIESRTLAQTVASEILPLAAACRWLEKNAEKTLQTRRHGWWKRPLWLHGVSGETSRTPHGLVLILGTWNYPIFLTGVQLLQALVAGNTVLVKPGQGCVSLTNRLVALLTGDSEPETSPSLKVNPAQDAVRVLGETAADGIEAMQRGVDHVVLTGSAETGKRVLTQAAESLTSATVELSGCDAMYVLPRANRERVAKSIAFGLQFNSSATCIAPRRILLAEFGPDALQAELKVENDRLLVERSTGFVEEQLIPVLNELSIQTSAETWKGVDELLSDAKAKGAAIIDRRDECGWILVDHATSEMQVTQVDVFAPIISVVHCHSMKTMIAAGNDCPYALAASVFGSREEAAAIKPYINVGTVTINDLIVPTADPRIPFGGVHSSGFGVTRGPEGLLEMTRPKTTLTRRTRWLPHLDQEHEDDAELLAGAAEMLYGSSKWTGFKKMMAAGRKRSIGR